MKKSVLIALLLLFVFSMETRASFPGNPVVKKKYQGWVAGNFDEFVENFDDLDSIRNVSASTFKRAVVHNLKKASTYTKIDEGDVTKYLFKRYKVWRYYDIPEKYRKALYTGYVPPKEDSIVYTKETNIPGDKHNREFGTDEVVMDTTEINEEKGYAIVSVRVTPWFVMDCINTCFCAIGPWYIERKVPVKRVAQAPDIDDEDRDLVAVATKGGATEINIDKHSETYNFYSNNKEEVAPQQKTAVRIVDDTEQRPISYIVGVQPTVTVGMREDFGLYYSTSCYNDTHPYRCTSYQSRPRYCRTKNKCGY